MKAIIIDDERHGISTLQILLRAYHHIEIIGVFENPIEALKSINDIDFDLLFLDIEMPHINGFELLALLPQHKFHVIFTTAYDEFAVQAFKVNALDYLLKPIDKVDLKNALDKFQKKAPIEHALIQNIILNEFNSKLHKIAIPTMAGLEMIVANDIIYIESQSNYSKIHMVRNSHTISKTLKSFSLIAKGYGFVRIHNSYIVNPNHIVRYVKGDGGYVIMDNGHSLNVSRSKKEDLVAALNILL